MDIESFRHDDWTPIWSGHWSLLTCSNFDEQYTQQIKFDELFFLSQSVFVVEKGKSTAWMRYYDKDKLGKYLASKIEKDIQFAKKTCINLKKTVDDVIYFIDKYEDKKISVVIYKKLWELILAYYPPHQIIDILLGASPQPAG